MVHEEVKKAVANGDIVSLKYIFCDCLDGDPTFSSSKDDYEYCKSKGILFVPHEELHPMTCDSVNERYWVQLKKDFIKNPSIERMEHMREVAKILYHERIQRIEQENTKKTVQKPVTKTVQTESVQPSIPTRRPTAQPTMQTSNQAGSSVRKVNNFAGADEGVRKATEQVKIHNTINDDGIRKVSELKGKPSYTSSSAQSEQPKKVSGMGRIIAVLVVIAIIVAVIVAISLMGKPAELLQQTEATHPGM